MKERKESNGKVMKEILNNLKCTRIYVIELFEGEKKLKICQGIMTAFSKFREKKELPYKLSKEHRHREVYTQISE